MNKNANRNMNMTMTIVQNRKSSNDKDNILAKDQKTAMNQTYHNMNQDASNSKNTIDRHDSIDDGDQVLCINQFVKQKTLDNPEIRARSNSKKYSTKFDK